MSTLLALASTAALAASPAGQASPLPCCATFDHEHGLLTAFLEEYVHGDSFDYAAAKKEPELLGQYLEATEAVTPEAFAEWSKEQRYAFWVNAYNAYTLQVVLDNYPVSSIRDIGSADVSVWDRPLAPLALLVGKKGDLTLNQIEHEILRPQFEDPRVHAAVNCASKGCPPLRSGAFTAAKLDEQLDAQVTAWLADPARNRFDERTKTAHLSKIFEWFASDFESAGGALEWVTKRAPASARAWLADSKKVSVRHLEYDWALNDVRRSK